MTSLRIASPKMPDTLPDQGAPGANQTGPDTDTPEQSDTALQDCLRHICAELGHPITDAALHAASVSARGPIDIRRAIDIAHRAGLQAGFGKTALKNLDAASLPALVLLQDGGAVVVHRRLSAGRLVVFDPRLGEGLGEVSLSALALSYSGYALLLRPEHSGSGTDGSGHDATGRRRRHWFWGTLAQNKWMYAQVGLAAVLANLLGLSTSLFIMVVYDRILPNEALESLAALTAGVGVALVFDFIIKTLRASFIDRAGQRADRAMGREIFDQVLDMQMASRRGSTGALASTLREFESLRDFFTSATMVAVVDLPFVTLFVGVIYLIAGPLALVPAIAVPVVLLVGLAVQPLLARLAENSFADGQSKQGVLVETVAGLETIKASGAGPLMRDRWERAITRQSDHGLRSRAISQFALNATAFTQQAAQVMIVVYGVMLISAGQTSMGALIAAVILTGRALAPLAQIAQTLTRLNGARSSYKSLNRLMGTPTEHPAGRRWLSRPRLSGKITLRDVTFSYPDQGIEALSNISLTIQPGEKVAILGRIGSGKSTIARLLLGLYPPASGAVLADDTDLRQIDPGDLRRNVGSVLQDAWLFSGTIRDNIAIGAARPHDQDILHAARVAGVDDFVRRNPQGYDMPLAERGEGLSGGQKQSIALARALLGRPPVLLLDEPTSAMDVQTEAAVLARLKAEVADRTLIVITHRVSLLDLVDRVIVIDQGKVVADGPKSILNRGASSTPAPTPAPTLAPAPAPTPAAAPPIKASDDTGAI